MTGLLPLARRAADTSGEVFEKSRTDHFVEGGRRGAVMDAPDHGIMLGLNAMMSLVESHRRENMMLQAFVIALLRRGGDDAFAARRPWRVNRT